MDKMKRLIVSLEIMLMLSTSVFIYASRYSFLPNICGILLDNIIQDQEELNL